MTSGIEPFLPPLAQGLASKQAHVAIPENTYEEELGTEGFDGPAAHIYHKNPPTSWKRVEGECRPRALYLSRWVGKEHDVEKPMLYNDDVRLGGWHLGKSMDYLRRNIGGDRLLFVHEGEGNLISEFGVLAFSEGDYLVLPRGTTYQIHLSSEKAFFYCIDAVEEHIGLPKRGILGKHAHVDPGVYTVSELEGKPAARCNAEGEWVVHLEDGHDVTKVYYDFDPIDVAGWKGDLFPYKVNWRDIKPIISHSYHLPPSVHATFVGLGFYVITFVPRPHENTEEAQKVPFYHRNIDYDETIFYHQGNFFSKKSVEPAMVTWHPRGIHHGPHPKSYREQDRLRGKMANEVAVMVDTRRPLKCVPGFGEGTEDMGYVNSWQE